MMVHKHPFMKAAYEAKKWAFVADYARIDVIHEYGGVYLDTDVELIKKWILIWNMIFMPDLKAVRL